MVFNLSSRKNAVIGFRDIPAKTQSDKKHVFATLRLHNIVQSDYL